MRINFKLVLSFVPVFLLGLLVFNVGSQHSDTSRVQADYQNQGLSASIYYSEPADQLESMKIDSNIKTDINENNIRIFGVDVWKGDHPRYIIAAHYSDANTDLIERRIIFVLRNSVGDPWIVADVPVVDPTGGINSQPNKTIWFAVDVDRTILQSNPHFPESWLSEVISLPLARMASAV